MTANQTPKKIPDDLIAAARRELDKLVNAVVSLKRQYGVLVGLCPLHNEQTPSFTLYDDHFYCFGCGAVGDAIDFVRATRQMSFVEAVEWILGGNIPSEPVAPRDTREADRRRADQDRRVRENIAYARRIWRESRPIQGTLAEEYLRGRCIDIDLPPTLRFHPGLKHESTGLLLPAMIGHVSVWPARKPCAVHRTYLGHHGKKAGVSKPKMFLGPVAGGAVRLAPHGHKLAVAEGIETALSVSILSGLPTWCVLSRGGFSSLVLPPDVGEIVIAADNDEPGLEAAHNVAELWRKAGRIVRIAVPEREGADFNDVLAESNPQWGPG